MKVKFAWYDCWVGAYWDRQARVLYVCPLPMLVVVVPFGPSAEGRVLDTLSEWEGLYGMRGLDLREKAKVPAWRFYSLLGELEERGLVRRTVGVNEEQRGGRPAHFFSLTDEGWQKVGQHGH